MTRRKPGIPPIASLRHKPLSRGVGTAGRSPASLLLLALCFLLFLLLAACGVTEGTAPAGPTAAPDAGGLAFSPATVAQPAEPAVALSLTRKDVTLAPQPLRAGTPFTITAVIHNKGSAPAEGVPVMAHLYSEEPRSGYLPFVTVVTATVPATRPLSLQIPVRWNLAGGKHHLSLRVNRLPEAWQARTPVLPEKDVGDNTVLLDLTIEPFDDYTSTLCPGRVDVELVQAAALPLSAEMSVWVRVLNSGNRAVYHLPVIVKGDGATGLAYTPPIPPCGGTADLLVEVDRPLRAGESLTVQVNPPDWPDVLSEDNVENNQVSVSVSSLAGAAVPAEAEDYDFRLLASDIEMPQTWLVQVRVQNLGTRDAAMVPIRVENQAGRKLTDAIPLVQGSGWGVAAIRVGYLWTRGGTLTFTVNPPEARGSYPETNHDDNVATFTLP